MKKLEKKPDRKNKIQQKKPNVQICNTSLKTIKTMGITAIYPEESIFQKKTNSEKNVFIKIYSIEWLENSTQKKETLFRLLCVRCSFKKIRISAFQYSTNNMPFFFLSVYLDGNSYENISDEIANFDQLLEEITKQINGIVIKPCNINDIFMYIFMNTNGQIKKINTKMVLKKNTDWEKEYLRNIYVREDKFQQIDSGKYGCCYMIIQHQEKMENLFLNFSLTNCMILRSTDIQSIPQQYIAPYKEYIEHIYSGKTANEKMELLNGSFLFCVLVSSEEEMNKIDKSIGEHAANNNLVITKCTGIEKMVVNSIATMGLIDFHCMRHVTEDMIIKFFV